MDDLESLSRRIMALERQTHRVKFGTVHQVRKDGAYRIDWGEAYQSQDEGSQDGQGGDAGGGGGGGAGGGDDSTGGSKKPLLSPWIRQGHHHGFINENIPFKKGQTVVSLGMDPDHRVAAVFPYSHSDDNPKDGNQNTKQHTYRIRKPDKQAQKEDQQQQGEQQLSSQGQAGTKAKKGKDDDDDVQYIRDYDIREIKIGKTLRILYQREHEEEQDQQGQAADAGGGGGAGGGGQQKPLQYRIEVGGDNSKNKGQDQEGKTEDDGPTVIEVKKNSVHLTTKTKNVDIDTMNVNFKTVNFKGDNFNIDAKSTFKKDVIHEKKTFLGGADADKPVSMKGTVDTGGYVDDAPVSQTAFTK